jgi:hypothetical protein
MRQTLETWRLGFELFMNEVVVEGVMGALALTRPEEGLVEVGEGGVQRVGDGAGFLPNYPGSSSFQSTKRFELWLHALLGTNGTRDVRFER